MSSRTSMGQDFYCSPCQRDRPCANCLPMPEDIRDEMIDRAARELRLQSHAAGTDWSEQRSRMAAEASLIMALEPLGAKLGWIRSELARYMREEKELRVREEALRNREGPINTHWGWPVFYGILAVTWALVALLTHQPGWIVGALPQAWMSGFYCCSWGHSHE